MLYTCTYIYVYMYMYVALVCVLLSTEVCSCVHKHYYCSTELLASSFYL